MVNEYHRSRSPTTMKQKRQSCRNCISGCFSSPSTSTSTNHPFNVLQNEDNNNGRARSPRSPMPEIKDKCLHLISKLGGGSRGGWAGRPGRRRHSADFSYDPSSYALNFEDSSSGSRNDELLLRGFPAPPPPPNAKSSASGASTAHHLEEESCRGWNRRPSPEKKGTSLNLLARIEGRGGQRRYSSSSDFSYDPSSYALNFQDEVADELSGFSARFQPPPPRAKCSTLRPEVVGFS